MAEDIFDFTENKLTLRECVSIAKRAVHTIADDEGFPGEYIFHDDYWDEYWDAHMDYGYKALKRKEIENVSLGKFSIENAPAIPDMWVEINHDYIKFNIIVLSNNNKYGTLEERKTFCEKYHTYMLRTFQSGNVRYSITFPQIKDEYFECYFEALLRNAMKIQKRILDDYSTYRNYMEM